MDECLLGVQEGGGCSCLRIEIVYKRVGRVIGEVKLPLAVDEEAHHITRYIRGEADYLCRKSVFRVDRIQRQRVSPVQRSIAREARKPFSRTEP